MACNPYATTIADNTEVTGTYPTTACSPAQQRSQQRSGNRRASTTDNGDDQSRQSRLSTKDILCRIAQVHQQTVRGNFQAPACLITPALRDLTSLAFPSQPYTQQTRLSHDDSRDLTSLSRLRHNTIPNHPIKTGAGPQQRCGVGVQADLDFDLGVVDGDSVLPSDEYGWEVQAMQSTIPPVTIDNLKELELPAIQNTLSLRIDLCFDHDLFFQRISGLKGEEKRTKAKIYYQCLSLELQAITHDLQGSCQECLGQGHEQYFHLPSRLASFFTTLRDLLELLVPENEKEDVVQKIDVEWLTKQVRTGQFDLVSFSTWLCDLITSHCAPMRDEMAQDMRDKVIAGAETNNMDLLVQGLETLLNLLENMKIDVANHQVRSFKLLLISDTVPFLRDCFKKMIENHQLDVLGSKRWFASLCKQHEFSSESAFECVVLGLVDICCDSNKSLPSTLSYDKERLQVLQNDIVDLIQLDICLETFEELARKQPGRHPSPSEVQRISDRLKQLMTNDGVCEGVELHREEIIGEIARAAAGVGVGDVLSTPSNIATVHFDQADLHLRRNLRQKYSHGLEVLTSQLSEKTSWHANRFSRLPDTLAISNDQRSWSARRSEKGFSAAPDLEDIARRLAHIAVIHWQVWHDLVYLGNPFGSEDMFSGFRSSGTRLVY
ncbi:Protein SOSEKI 1 [Lithohypha guttulata]|uniref:Protein SOSEKI 1 n=1 Tax=Lithohypha guttulata TaxID=1690604 RepID=UPI002DDE9C30|nr:Protein SOSEKI 1 [Lithohypha guttulata]